MYRKLALSAGVLCLAAIGLVVPARADIVVPGADGSDGAFNPTDPNTVIDLSLAPTGEWNGSNQSPGYGVYDPNQWAVVFRYSAVNIPTGKTVTFLNHPSRAPVVWLVSGSVTISGSVNLDGKYTSQQYVGFLLEPGAGGFRGGTAWLGTGAFCGGGFGPGGGLVFQSNAAGGGSYATVGSNGGPTYGNARVLPLIGGSGSGGYSGSPGSGGGGAILMAASTTITVNGAIYARGVVYNNYSSAGGGIRLIADDVSGTTGVLRATSGNYGGNGRIRIEANSVTLSDPGAPAYTIGLPGTTATIWPPADAPTVEPLTLGAAAVPSDPRGSFDFPYADVAVADPNAQTLVIEARNVPLNWIVKVRVVPRVGQDFTVNATYVSGNVTLSTWQAQLTLPNGFAAIQVRASAP
jgi:hypothetical protein